MLRSLVGSEMCIRDSSPSAVMGMWVGVGEAHTSPETSDTLIARWHRTFDHKPRVCDIVEPRCRGWLLKKATITGRWKPIYFLLSQDGVFIYYFETDQAEAGLKGLICLEGGHVELNEPMSKYERTVCISTDFPRRPDCNMQSSVYYLRAESAADFHEWSQALHSCKANLTVHGRNSGHLPNPTTTTESLSPDAFLQQSADDNVTEQEDSLSPTSPLHQVPN
eukprot:TRINITY_DN13938_c0_g1_i1.p1 TRINITY_DN13938_c0_g1~~TRINITY_DN13938_c0_g1_i1.p1  ORF type:complete len:222 (+),score=55.00 TRINITY_DN13938_c0_g1_i1:150-815(+)